MARYIEIFTVRRLVNRSTIAQNSIRNTMYPLVKEIRRKDIGSLREILQAKLTKMEENWSGLDEFRMHGRNKRFVKYLLARITTYIEQESGITSAFETYYDNPTGKPFEIEHIWANKFAEHKDEFDQENEFENYRNRFGGLLLLPSGSNQSYGDKSYEKKLKHYIKENLLAKSLCELAYDNNPNFKNMYSRLDLKFKPYESFKKSELMERQQLYRSIAQKIWSDKL